MGFCCVDIALSVVAFDCCSMLRSFFDMRAFIPLGGKGCAFPGPGVLLLLGLYLLSLDASRSYSFFWSLSALALESSSLAAFVVRLYVTLEVLGSFTG